MYDIDYLKMMSRQFPNIRLASAEIINLKAICQLPKGTEYFFSDLHGEYESFIHLLRSSSGVTRNKINAAFGDLMPESEQLALADLIYYPERVLRDMRVAGTLTAEWQRITINRLLKIAREVSGKYTRSKVRKKLPKEYAYALDELLHSDEHDDNKTLYFKEFMNSIIEVDIGEDFIMYLCRLIQSLTIDHLHIIGDIFDRGPRADIIMDELINFHDVDIQWGNHDISWIGAAAGNKACIATVLRIATSYNSFDVIEDGYGINLRPLSMFAAEVYADDPCEFFYPHMLDRNIYDSVNPDLAAKMCKAISVIEFKIEGQMIKAHPEYMLDERLLLDKINYEDHTITIKGKEYSLKDCNFPTVDPSDPYKLTAEEEKLMETITLSFTHSERLDRHVRFLFSNGSVYKIYNGNLLYHGCIPMNTDGSFKALMTPDGMFSGKELMDYVEKKAIDAYFLDEREAPDKKKSAVDFMWYLWCGPVSPLFGKDRLTSFEHVFLKDEKELLKENYNPYYSFSTTEKGATNILKEFGLEGENCHIINGHVPVKVKKGESPVKAGGKLFIIDGGLSKAYQETTGIAGYTLIFNSHYLFLAAHKPFSATDNTPELQVVHQFKERMLVGDTDIGRELKKEADALKALIEAYETGLLKENNTGF
ncbi:MAG: fructose-1,6-bisphosphatase [Lachnospiraceae bacterium]|nr:fructose-1,6-bisphosphatase [Lachnospiraceae bacterium]